jgi:hypothetical protein
MFTFAAALLDLSCFRACVFLGQKENPADVFIDILSGVHKNYTADAGEGEGDEGRRVRSPLASADDTYFSTALAPASPRVKLAEQWEAVQQQPGGLGAFVSSISGGTCGDSGWGEAAGGGDEETASLSGGKEALGSVGTGPLDSPSEANGAVGLVRNSTSIDVNQSSDNRSISQAASQAHVLRPPPPLLRSAASADPESDLSRARRTVESSLRQLAVRLQEHGGRRTPGWARQLALFYHRQATQLLRGWPLIAKNCVTFGLAALILGALYADAVADWPDGGGGFCNPSDDDGSSCEIDDAGTRTDDSAGLAAAPVLGPGDCEARVWTLGLERGLDLTYRQVFTLTLLAVALLSVQQSLELFGGERFVFWRESRHHSVWMYALGKFLATLPLSLLYPLCFTMAFHTLFNPMGSFATYYAVVAATGFAAEGLGVLLSVAFPDTRQVAGGVAALTMAMFTGCFPLFSASSAGQASLFHFSFLRYSAQLLFRAEYLALTGLEAVPWCASNAPSCLQHSVYFGRSAFWLPPGDPSLTNASTVFADCPLPWALPNDAQPVHTDDGSGVTGDDDGNSARVAAADDGGQWDAQCCGVNLYRMVDADLMAKNYGYSLAPDGSFSKLLAFAATFRVLAVLVLIFKDTKRRR